MTLGRTPFDYNTLVVAVAPKYSSRGYGPTPGKVSYRSQYRGYRG